MADEPGPAGACFMSSINSNNLTEEEIMLLPSLVLSDPKVETLFQSLLYGRNGLVVAKLPDFAFSKDCIYPRRSNESLDDEVSNGSFNLPLLTWEELSKKDFPREEWRVTGLIPMQGLVIIAAPSGEKKTWFALELIKSISCGSHFLAHEGFNTHRSKVLYIDAEMGPKILQKRCKLLDFDSIPEKFAPLLSTGNEINLKADDAFESFEKLIEDRNIDVIVIDTLRAVAGGLEEDNAPAVRGFLQRFNRLKNKGKLIIILDHNRKPDRGSHGGPRKEYVLGSQDKIANAEVVLMIRGDVNPGYFTVHQVKNRTGVEMKPFNVGIRDITTSKDGMEVVKVEMNYEGELDEMTTKMDEAKLVIPQIVGNEFMTTNDIVKIMAKNHDIAERYCREALRQMVDSGILEQSKKGRSYTFRMVTVNLFDQPKVDD